MKYEIMLSILFELLSKKSVTAKYLSEKYEVSVRSIYRYINCLEMAGIPLYTNRGNGGGISIMDTFKFSSTFMTVTEFEQTINALTGIVEGVPNKTLNNVINKLKSLIKNEYVNLNLSSGNLIIDAAPWGDAVGYKSKLAVIQKCIEECLELDIQYHDRNGIVSNRVIEPHIIVFKQGLWYVYAYCKLRKEFRFFKIGRIEHARYLDNKFIRREIKKSELPLNFWENSVETVNVVMEVKNSCISDVEEWLGIENVKQKDGKFIAEAVLPNDAGLISKIISFGNGIKVVSPIDIKNKIKIASELILEEYK